MESTRVTKFSSGKTVVDTTKKGYGFIGTLRLILCYAITIMFWPFALCCCIEAVKEYERVVVFRLGRIHSNRAKGPGLVFHLFIADKSMRMDLRTKTFDIDGRKDNGKLEQGQVLLTNDSVEILVKAVCNMKIVDPVRVAMSVTGEPGKYHEICKELAATVLRETLGTRTLDEILSDRDGLAQQMQITLDSVTEEWGIKIERVEIKEVILASNMVRSMASVAEADRDAVAQLVAAQAEYDASESLKKAGEVMSLNPSTMHLRYLQTLNQIGADKNTTYLFPMPTELLDYLKRK